jgi:hypothetical protein
MTQQFTPTIPVTAPGIPPLFTVTTPALEDNANIVVAFNDYHTSLSWYLNDSVKKTTATAQTISSALTVSGATTINGATLTVSSGTINFSNASATITFSSPSVSMVKLTASTGVNSDILAEDGSTKILENGNGGAISFTGAGNTLTAYNNAVFSGTSAVARSAVLYKAAGGDFTNIDGYRRIFVGASSPSGPGLQAGDIWMW